MRPSRRGKPGEQVPNGDGAWVFIDKSSGSFQSTYKALDDWQRELIARRWLKARSFFWAKQHRLVNSFFMHILSCCRQPAGRADGTRGSQQCSFELEVFDMQCLGVLAILPTHFEQHLRARYSINENNAIEWQHSSSIDSYYIDDMSRMSNWISFETRDVAKHLPVFGSSKGVLVRNEGVKVLATLIPPFIIELCRRSHDRLVLAVTFNMFTFNDLEGLDLPPGFPYAFGERAKFRALAIKNLMGMVNNNVELSRSMQRLLPPAYRNGEDEGEEADGQSSSHEDEQ